MLTLLSGFQVLAVSQQQILGTLIDAFIRFAGFPILIVSNNVDNAAKSGDHMKQVEYDFGTRYFFLTALMNGSHMSITTALMPSSCLSLS